MADKTFAASVETQQKEALLRGTYEWAQQNEKFEFFDKAAEDYRKVVADGPGTDWALKAKNKLEALQKDKKIKP
jgi:hypothetical protein